MFDSVRYLTDRNISFKTSASNLSPGWVGIACPFCSNPHGPRGGFSPEGYYNCWRCGWHSLEDLVMALEQVSYHEACRIVREYDSDEIIQPRKAEIIRPPAVAFPSGTGSMQARHKDYLAGRRFDPDWLEEKYGLMGTGPVGDYANRIIAPVMFGETMVSYQGRDITDRAEPKYKACPSEYEVMHHKRTLYNIDNVGIGPLVVVEGITDVWRLGDRAVATFGTKFTWQQITLMAKWERVFILYDSEDTAQRQASRICDALSSLGARVSRVRLPGGDPGGLTDNEARKLMEDLI